MLHWSNFPETNQNLDSILAWKLSIASVRQTLLIYRRENIELGLQGNSTFVLCLCHHFILLQGSGMQENSCLKFNTSKWVWAVTRLGCSFNKSVTSLVASSLGHGWPVSPSSLLPSMTMISVSSHFHIAPNAFRLQCRWTLVLRMLGSFTPLPQPQPPVAVFTKVSVKKQTRELLGLTTGSNCSTGISHYTNASCAQLRS